MGGHGVATGRFSSHALLLSCGMCSSDPCTTPPAAPALAAPQAPATPGGGLILALAAESFSTISDIASKFASPADMGRPKALLQNSLASSHLCLPLSDCAQVSAGVGVAGEDWTGPVSQSEAPITARASVSRTGVEWSAACRVNELGHMLHAGRSFNLPTRMFQRRSHGAKSIRRRCRVACTVRAHPIPILRRWR